MGVPDHGAQPSTRLVSTNSAKWQRDPHDRKIFNRAPRASSGQGFTIRSEANMNRQRVPPATALSVTAIALLSLVACGDDPSSSTAALLPRNTVVPVSVVTQYFPDVTKEASTGPNETSVGKPIASRSVVFTSADGKKKVTLSVDQYAGVSEAAAAYETAVQGSKAAPGFKPAASPDLGQEAFAGTSQVGAEMHFGLGARDGSVIISATHAGDIPVTPDNSNKLISLGGAELTTANRVLGVSGSS
jgi:hypothetical protein